MEQRYTTERRTSLTQSQIKFEKEHLSDSETKDRAQFAVTLMELELKVGEKFVELNKQLMYHNLGDFY